MILTAKENANDDRCQFDAALERQFEERDNKKGESTLKKQS